MNKNQLIESLRTNGFPEKIVSAISEVKRELFVPDRISAYAYEDMALPIEEGVTLSQPYTVAFMLNHLDVQENQNILEIGSGSGYVLALISSIMKNGKVRGLEIVQRLAVKSKSLLHEDKNIEIVNRDGSKGLLEYAPFDRILISASCPDRYIPYKMIDQLNEGGIIVAAVKDYILYLKKENGQLIEKEFPGFLFVPLRKSEEVK